MVIPNISQSSGTLDASGQTPLLIHLPIAGLDTPKRLESSACDTTFSIITF